MTLWGWDWGDVPTWIAAVFGGGAFAGALLLFRVEAQRDREQAFARRQQQASLVTGWVGNNQAETSLALYLQNASAACVYDIFVLYNAFGQTLDYDLIGVLRPSGSLGPRVEDVTDKALTKYGEILPTIAPSQWDNIRPIIYFRDSSNACWMRDRGGMLVELRDGEWIPDDIALDRERRRADRYRQMMEERANRENQSGEAN